MQQAIELPVWTLLPFVALLLAIALVPTADRVLIRTEQMDRRIQAAARSQPPRR